jgi:hypothetical protein
MTQIIIKTQSWLRNKNYQAILDALNEEGYEITGRQGSYDYVMITTNAPRNFVERIEFTRSAVTIRG